MKLTDKQLKDRIEYEIDLSKKIKEMVKDMGNPTEVYKSYLSFL